MSRQNGGDWRFAMKRGFTLIEVMVAAAILAIGCLGVLAMMLTVIQFNAASHDRTSAVFLAEQQLSRLEVLATVETNWENGAFVAKVAGDNAAISNSWQYLKADTNVAFPNGYKVAIRQHQPDPGTSTTPTTGFFGEMRVIWSTTETACDVEASALINFDTFANAQKDAYKHCAFVTLPFVLNKP